MAEFACFLHVATLETQDDQRIWFEEGLGPCFGLWLKQGCRGIAGVRKQVFAWCPSFYRTTDLIKLGKTLQIIQSNCPPLKHVTKHHIF